MFDLKGWISGLVIISIVSAIVLILTPSGSVEKQVKTVIAVVLSVAFLLPFASENDIDTESLIGDIDFTIYSAFDNNKALVDAFETETEKSIKNSLYASGFLYESVRVDVNINNDSELTVEKVTVKIPAETGEQKNGIKEHIRNLYGINAEIEVSNE